MMKRMIAGANIQTNKKLSNHSARKFLIQKLNDNNVPPNRIMQISGHKNVNSINNYSHINQTQHKDISRILHSNLDINTADLQASSSKSIQAASTANVSIHGGIQTLFAGPIHGANFNIHVHQNSPYHSPDRRSRKRVCLIDSDLD